MQGLPSPPGSTGDYKGRGFTDNLYKPAVSSYSEAVSVAILLLYLALGGKCSHCIAMQKDVWVCRFKLQTRCESSTTFTHTQKKKTLWKTAAWNSDGEPNRRTSLSPCPPERRLSERRDGICGPGTIWAEEAGARTRAHPPPPPPAPRYTHDWPAPTASGKTHSSHTHADTISGSHARMLLSSHIRVRSGSAEVSDRLPGEHGPFIFM